MNEKYFVVWLAEKSFFEADSLVKERQAVSEITDLLRYIDDPLVLDQCIEQLNKIHGRTKFWKDAVSQARGEAKRQKSSASSLDERQREVEDLRKAGLFIRDNCYYTIGDEEEDPVMISNFIMEPLFHIGDDNSCLRLPSKEFSIRMSLLRKAPRSETSGICFKDSRQRENV